MKPGAHYALLATTSVGDITAIMGENVNSLEKVALVAGSIPSTPFSLFADSGCMIHFFKSRDVFTSYRPLSQVVGQLLKEGTNFTILGTGNVEL